jgi:hypothetical protein
VLAGGLRTRSPIGEVVGIRAVGDDLEAARAGNRHELAPELRLAEVAPVARVGRIPRVVELLGVQLEHADVERPRDISRRRPLRRG